MDDGVLERTRAGLRNHLTRRRLGTIVAGALAAIGLVAAPEAKKKKKKKKKPPAGCRRDCAGKTCGDDGCGGSCGGCDAASGLECRGGRCASYQLVKEWGSRGTGDGQFRTPRGIGVDSTGHVYVVDTFNHRVQKFTNDGTYDGQWGGEGDDPGQFDGPWGLTVDQGDFVYVVDTDNFRVQKFSSAGGAPVATWGEPPEPDIPAAPGQLSTPAFIAASNLGLIYVSDNGRILDDDRVKVYSNNGSAQGQFGASGTGDGQFVGVRGIAVDSTGNIYVADRGNWRIVKFRSDGDFLDAWGERGSEPGQFSEMEGMAIDGDDRLYLADEVNKCILKFDTNGELINVISGSMFFGPAAVAVDRNGNVFVSDGRNGSEHILKFALSD